MKENLFRRLLLFAMSKEHRTRKISDGFAEIANEINHIFVTVLDHSNIQVRYNTTYDTVLETVSMPAVYSFLDESLGRRSAHRVQVKSGEMVSLHEWKEQLSPVIHSIEAEKNYDHYLKKVKAESPRFDVEYFDYIVIIRDKDEELLTNVLDLNAAVVACK